MTMSKINNKYAILISSLVLILSIVSLFLGNASEQIRLISTLTTAGSTIGLISGIVRYIKYGETTTFKSNGE